MRFVAITLLALLIVAVVTRYSMFIRHEARIADSLAEIDNTYRELKGLILDVLEGKK